MAKKRKKKHESGHVDESWLLPYSDLMTLLLALFIVLFATSSVDVQKLQQFSEAFSQIFDGGTSFLETPSSTPLPVAPEREEDENEDAAYLEDQEALGEIQDRVDNYIAVNELEKQFETKLTDEGLLVTIRDSILFDPGSADVKEEYLPIARDIGDLLSFDPPRHIIVKGHTDNVPMNTSEFRSNWELSVMRSVNFLKIILENQELDPLLFSAKGYGEYQPIASNDTTEGRAKNRRVEVLIEPLVLKDGTSIEKTE
ncbi:flagellar motor protein MotB [Chungangia koreensis]|uniref:Flagellar motor protein MotB n=1 Tax=Chungangia koreensis TaxID=752657 RepID=A0ABV8X4V6_9LACT